MSAATAGKLVQFQISMKLFTPEGTPVEVKTENYISTILEIVDGSVDLAIPTQKVKWEPEGLSFTFTGMWDGNRLYNLLLREYPSLRETSRKKKSVFSMTSDNYGKRKAKTLSAYNMERAAIWDKMMMEGLSIKEIADRSSISERVVNDILKRYWETRNDRE